MRQALTISLPEKTALEMDKFIKEEGNTRSHFIREAIQDYIYFRKLRKLRDKMTLKAQKNKIFTDEDVFKLVS